MAEGNVGIWGWDNGFSLWRKIHVDALGNLQVDVLTSALPAGGATAANQALIIADTGTLVAQQGRCYGWDSANWQRLLFEGVGLHNLRVRLYGGANAVLVGQSSAALAYTNYGIETFATLYADDGTNLSRVGMLLAGADAVDNTLNVLGVASMLYGYNGVSWDRVGVEHAGARNLRIRSYIGNTAVTGENWGVGGKATAAKVGLFTCTQNFLIDDAANVRPWASGKYVGDGNSGRGVGAVAIYGWNGSTWDRLRVYPTGILKVGRAEVGLLDVRMVAVGQVGAAGARKLYWMLLNPGAGNSVVELTDAAAGGAAIKADHFDTTRDGHMITFDPPLEFTTGIYLETFTNMTSITFGYL